MNVLNQHTFHHQLFFRIVAPLLVMTLLGCAPLDRGILQGAMYAELDYDVVIPYDSARAVPLDMPEPGEEAEDCNGNGIDDAFDWAGYIPRGPYAVGSRPYDLAAGRLNSDSRLDLAVANFGTDTATVLRQGRDRRFHPEGDFTVGVLPACITIKDVTGDEIADILVGHESSVNAVTVLANLGGGDSYDATDHPISSDPFYARPPQCVIATNLDSGLPDVLAASGEGGAGTGTNRLVSVFFNTDFTSPQHLPLPGVMNPGRLVSADFDNDGDTDFCVTSNLEAELTCVKNSLDFPVPPDFDRWEFIPYPTGQRPVRLVAADLNGDDLVDIAVAGSAGVSLLYNTGRGIGFCAEYDHDAGYCRRKEATLFEAPIGPLDLGGAVAAIAAADLDADDDIDLAVTLPEQNKVVFLANRGGRGEFTDRHGSPLKRELPVSDEPKGILAADLDRDGRIEVAVTNAGSDDVWVLHHRANPPNMMLDCPLRFEMEHRFPEND